VLIIKDIVLVNNIGMMLIKNQLEFRNANYGMVFVFCSSPTRMMQRKKQYSPQHKDAIYGKKQLI
jgi:hypothetical protein